MSDSEGIRTSDPIENLVRRGSEWSMKQDSGVHVSVIRVDADGITYRTAGDGTNTTAKSTFLTDFRPVRS